MSKNFWSNLDKPILSLAPLAGFTDSAYRQIASDFGAQVVYSEMVSATALFYNSAETLDLMDFNPKKEKNYIIQLFGSEPEHFAKAAQIISKKIKPAGIDLNCGCPVKKVLKQGAGASLMSDPQKARKIIEAILDNTNLPLSIKIRAGAGKMDALKFLDKLAGLDIKAVMIHGRTLAGAFSGPVDLELIKDARQHFSGIILANGGINNPDDIKSVLKATQADGVGIARGAMGNPWIFRQESRPGAKEVFRLMKKHARLVYKLKGNNGLVELRKHLVYYVNGLEGASKLRASLVKINSLKDLDNALSNF